MEWSVFVRSIKTTDHGTLIIEASNGRKEGPPFIRFSLPSSEQKNCHIGKRYMMKIKEA